jgi:predicted nucleotidyltransferase
VTITLETLRNEKRSGIMLLGEKYGAGNIRVFGSVARSENTPGSDVNFLVDLEKGRSLFDLAGLVADPEELLDTHVDVVTENGLRYLRERVISEAVKL